MLLNDDFIFLQTPFVDDYRDMKDDEPYQELEVEEII